MVMHEISTLDVSSTLAPLNEEHDLLEVGMQAVENALLEVLDSDVDVLRDASQHIVAAGGKRVRPRLLLLSYLAAGGDDPLETVPVAAAVEMVHTASVVHDDINDHGIIRRGRPSVNAVWGRTFALLTGDYLFTKVYELMAPFKDLNIDLAEATIALVEGETLQASAVKDNNLTSEIYFKIIERKTAALFKAAGGMGAKLANAKAAVVDALEQFGMNLGLAFQIVDDILDLTASSEQLGKTAGIDLVQGKGFAAVHDNNADPMENVKRKLLEGNRINEAYQQAAALAESGILMLDVLRDSPYKIALKALAREVVTRRH